MDLLIDFATAGGGVFVGWLVSAVIGPLLARQQNKAAKAVGKAVSGLLPMTHAEAWKALPALDLIDPTGVEGMPQEQLYPLYKEYVRRANALRNCISPMRAELTKRDQKRRDMMTHVERAVDDALAKGKMLELDEARKKLLDSVGLTANTNGGEDGSAIDSGA